MYTSSIILVLTLCFTFTLAFPYSQAPSKPRYNGKTCTVKAHGNKQDDTPSILAAFKDCNNGGIVVFPEEENYWIGTKLNPVLSDVTIEWKGIWTVCSIVPYLPYTARQTAK